MVISGFPGIKRFFFFNFPEGYNRLCLEAQGYLSGDKLSPSHLSHLSNSSQCSYPIRLSHPNVSQSSQSFYFSHPPTSSPPGHQSHPSQPSHPRNHSHFFDQLSQSPQSSSFILVMNPSHPQSSKSSLSSWSSQSTYSFQLSQSPQSPQVFQSSQLSHSPYSHPTYHSKVSYQLCLVSCLIRIASHYENH